MNTPLLPASETECAQMIAEAARTDAKLAIVGGNTRLGLGGTVSGTPLITTGLSGITLYEPAEMVISARAGTPLAEVEATLAGRGQMLPFEPMDHRAVLSTTGTPTIGAVAAGNVSGPRRVSAGASRDHLIGIRMVNGMGELIKSGGRVMKNVTGLDLVKLNAGALGTLGVLTEVTFKVLPRPETTLTLHMNGLDPEHALAAMCQAMATPYEVTAAAFIDAQPGTGSQTLLRIEGFAESCAYRAERLRGSLADIGDMEILQAPDAAPLWTRIRDAEDFAASRFAAVLRVHVAASKAAALIEMSRAAGATVMLDWGGALIWLGIEDSATTQGVMEKAAYLGGHPMVVRNADGTLPHQLPAHPAAAALGQRVKQAFDPKGLFNSGLLSGHL